MPCVRWEGSWGYSYAGRPPMYGLWPPHPDTHLRRCSFLSLSYTCEQTKERCLPFLPSFPGTQDKWGGGVKRKKSVAKKRENQSRNVPAYASRALRDCVGRFCFSHFMIRHHNCFRKHPASSRGKGCGSHLSRGTSQSQRSLPLSAAGRWGRRRSLTR